MYIQTCNRCGLHTVNHVDIMWISKHLYSCFFINMARFQISTVVKFECQVQYTRVSFLLDEKLQAKTSNASIMSHYVNTKKLHSFVTLKKVTIFRVLTEGSYKKRYSTQVLTASFSPMYIHTHVYTHTMYNLLIVDMSKNNHLKITKLQKKIINFLFDNFNLDIYNNI